MTTDKVKSKFVYESGRLVPGDPLGLEAEGGDTEKTLAARGYSPSQVVGDDNGLSYEVYEHESAGWVVLFSTSFRYCCIVCASWPDLIALLSTLSGIALAGIPNDHDADGRPCPCHMPVGPVKAYPSRASRSHWLPREATP